MMKHKVGVACIDEHTMKHPFIMHQWIKSDSFEEARDILLSDPSVQERKANDVVMLLAVSTGDDETENDIA